MKDLGSIRQGKYANCSSDTVVEAPARSVVKLHAPHEISNSIAADWNAVSCKLLCYPPSVTVEMIRVHAIDPSNGPQHGIMDMHRLALQVRRQYVKQDILVSGREIRLHMNTHHAELTGFGAIETCCLAMLLRSGENRSRQASS